MTARRGTALVTGASRGIGRATARRLAAAGYDVVAVARSREELDTLVREIEADGGAARALVLDVADTEAVRLALEGVTADVLVHNAGIGPIKPFVELTPEEWRRMWAVNVDALYHVTRPLLPGMLERERGHIVVIGSLAGRNAFVGGTAYAATKHAVVGFAESLMLEVRDRGVRVSIIMPGSVATHFFPPGTDTSWMLDTADVAEAVAHVVEAPERAMVSRIELRPSRPQKRR